jgi:hypothetical protein
VSTPLPGIRDNAALPGERPARQQPDAAATEHGSVKRK